MEPSFRGRAVLLEDTLVVADLHLGRSATSRVEAPVQDGEDVQERLADHLSTHDPESVVVAGDVLHAFDRIPRSVEGQLETIANTVQDHDASLTLVTGNHDTMLDSVWGGPTTEAHWIDDETVVVHGHEEPPLDANTYLLGHDHPAIEIEGQRHPCFLHGPGGPRDSDVLVLPAFNRFTAGVVVNGMTARDFQSPLVTDADALAPVVRDDDTGETLRFPPLGSFRHRLP